MEEDMRSASSMSATFPASPTSVRSLEGERSSFPEENASSMWTAPSLSVARPVRQTTPSSSLASRRSLSEDFSEEKASSVRSSGWCGAGCAPITWKREIKFIWREASPKIHLNDKADSDQYVINTEVSLSPPPTSGPPPPERRARPETWSRSGTTGPLLEPGGTPVEQ